MNGNSVISGEVELRPNQQFSWRRLTHRSVFLHLPAALWTFPSRHPVKLSSPSGLCLRTENPGKEASANNWLCLETRCLWGGAQMKHGSFVCLSTRSWTTCPWCWRPCRCFPVMPDRFSPPSAQVWHLEHQRDWTMSNRQHKNCLHSVHLSRSVTLSGCRLLLWMLP